MAFNAGSIDARMTLDRTAFTEGLKAARAQAKRFENRTIKAKLDIGSVSASREIEAFRRSQSGRDIDIPVDLNTSAVSAQLSRIVKATEKTAARTGSQLARFLLNPTIAAFGTLPAVAAASAAGVTASLSLAAAGFAGLAIAAHHSNTNIQSSFDALGNYVVSRVQDMTAGAIPEITQVAVMTKQAFNEVEQSLDAAFTGSGQQIQLLADAALRLGTEALPGITIAAIQSNAALRGLGDLAASTGQGVSNLFSIMATRSDEAARGMQSLGSITERLITLVGQLIAQFTDMWAEAGPQVAAMISNLADVVATFSNGALATFSQSLEVAATAVNGLLAAIEPFAGVLGAAAGGLLVFRGAMSALTSIGGRASRSLGKVAKTGGKLSGVLGGITKAGRRAGPVLGSLIGIVSAGGFVIEEYIDSADEMAAKILKGGAAARDAAENVSGFGNTLAIGEKRLYDVSTAFKFSADAGGAFSESANEVQQEINETLKKMSPLERAQLLAARAQRELTYAQNTYGKQSPKTAAAAAAYARAVDNLEWQQRQAKLATMGHTEAIVHQRTVMLGSIGSLLGYKGTLLQIKSQQKQLNKMVDEGKQDTLEYKIKLNGLHQTMVSSIPAFVDYAVKQAKANNVQDIAAVKSQAQAFAMARLATIAGDRVPPKLQTMINKIDDSTWAAIGATTKIDEMGNTVVTLPPGHSFKFNSNANSVKQQVWKLDDAIRNTPDSHTTNFYLNYIRSISGPAPGNASGLGVSPATPLGQLARNNEQGNILRYADGGKFQPMKAGLAQRVKPNTWRVIGDRATDDEAYIPINKSPRSRSLLQQTARDMGYQVEPMANGGILGGVSSGADTLSEKLDRIAELLAAQQPLSFNIGQASEKTVNEFADTIMTRLRHRRKELRR